jgi:DNA-binding transcriptional MocR family regulator
VGELEVLKVRDELLQAMYWMRAERLAETPSVRELSTFLAVPPKTLAAYVERFAAEGYLSPIDGGYRLTGAGEEAGKRGFADEFADLTKPGHGECDDDCWCHDSPEAAADCIEGRSPAPAHH